MANSANTKSQVYVTKEGLKELNAELKNLKEVKRQEVLVRLKEAISYGDLSENSEYEESKNEQAFVEGRILDIEDKIKNAQIIEENKGKSKGDLIQIGTTIEIQNLTDSYPAEVYTIVGSTEADPMRNRISNESPIGKALIGRHKGDRVNVEAPAGILEYKIINIK